MKVPMSWFSDYVNMEDITPKQFAADLTMSGSMVEGVDSKGENIINVMTGKIIKIDRHPDADKLVVCQVSFGEDDVVQIVTGATNELSCDGPICEPYTAFMQGGLTYEYGKLGIMRAIDEMLDLHVEPKSDFYF